MAKQIKQAIIATFIVVGGALLAPLFGAATLATGALGTLAATTFATTLVASVIGKMTSKGVKCFIR